MVLTDFVSASVLVAYLAVLAWGSISSSRLIRLASYGLCALTGLLIIFAYQSLIKSLGRPNYVTRSELLTQGRYHFLNDLNAQKVWFFTEDNLKLSGYLLTRLNPKGTILVFHGWRSSKDLLADYADAFPDYNLFFFDFRAHGESEGSFMTLGKQELADAQAALKFVQTDDKTKSLPIYGIGISLGGSIITMLAHDQPTAFKGLVIDSSFNSLRNSALLDYKKRTSLPVTPFFNMFRWLTWLLIGNDLNYCSAHYLHDIPTPTFVIHTKQDDRVSMPDAQALFDAAKFGAKGKYAEWWLLDNCPHGGICSANKEEYGKRVAEFFSKI